MQRRTNIAVVGALTALAALGPSAITLLAQEPAGTPRREARRSFAYAFSDNRGRIGVVVRTDASAESDKVGAKLEGVTPGGPADKAGLKVGDIITKFNGTTLAGAKAESEDDSGPGMQLIRLARKLEPGDTVRLEYRRGSDTKQATLVAEDLGGGFRMEIMPHLAVPRGMAMPMVPHLPDMSMDWNFSFGAPWGELELVNLNADLGEYFGTKDGVLVVKAPVDSGLALKGGDVIVSIGGRKPSSPAHAMRILRSYDKGETVSIEIMRHQKRMTVAWKVPSERQRRRVIRSLDDSGGDEPDEESSFQRVRPWHVARAQWARSV